MKQAASSSEYAVYKLVLHTERNDPLINNHIRVILEYWRANIDMQIILDPGSCAPYLAKYTTKAEVESVQGVEVLRRVLETEGNETQNLSRRAVLQLSSRDEVHYRNLGYPMVESNCYFISISLKENYYRLRRNLQFIDDTDNVLTISLIHAYVNRDRFEFS